MGIGIKKTLTIPKHCVVYIIGALCATASLTAQFPVDVSGQILYLVHKGQATEALTRYLNYVEKHEHDYTLLQQLGIALLEEGTTQLDPEIQITALMGAGVALSPPLLPLLEEGLHSKDPRTQLVALHFLTSIDDDQVDEILLTALNSPFLLTRLEALYQLSLKRHPAVLEHLQSLFVKIPEPIRPLFAQIVVNLDSVSANQMMRQLLSDHNLVTRCEAILAVAQKQRDDFLPQIRTLATQTQVAQQECVATTLGLLKDRSAKPLLEKMVQARQSNVQLAAAAALYHLGENAHLPLIAHKAEEHDLFAISLLAAIPTEHNRSLLASLTLCEDKDAQLGAALALLEMRDRRCLPVIEKLLLSETEAVGYFASKPTGRLIPTWRIVTSAPYKERSYPGILQQSAALRRQVLIACVELPEEDFLRIAQKIFDIQNKTLIPTVIELLANHHSPKTLSLLTAQYKNTSSDFVKAACLLTLCRAGAEGPYTAELIEWAAKRQQTLLIRFADNASPDRPSHYALTAEEESALLIQAFETLASTQSREGIEALIHAIAYGNVKNRYALAGLLIRTAE